MQKNLLEPLLNEAKQLEKKYEWLQAADYYRRSFDIISIEKDWLKVVEIHEQIGYCHYKAALQAKTNNEFKKQIEQSIHAHEETVKILENIEEQGNQTRINHAKASLAYAQSWLETNPQKKKEILTKWWTLENQVLKVHEQAGNLHSVGKTCNDLTEYSTYDRFWLGSNYLELKEMAEASVALAERAIEIFSKIDDEYELTRAYFSICWYNGFSSIYEEDEEKLIKIYRKCQEHANRALELSQKTGDAWLISKAYHSAWTVAQMLKWDRSTAIQYGEDMLKYGIITKDNYLLGFGKSLVSCSILLQFGLLEDPDRQRESLEKAEKMAKEAIDNFEVINHAGGFYVSYSYYIWPLNGLASIETDLKKRQALLEKAIKINHEGTERLKDWEVFSDDLLVYLSRSLLALSTTKTAIEEKKELLNDAQSAAKKHLIYCQKMRLFSTRISNALGLISSSQYELAKIESNITKKLDLLRKALGSIQESIEYLKKKQKFLTQSDWGLGANFGRKYNTLGEILQQLYSLQKEKKNLDGAIEAYKQAMIYFKKADLPTHTAESYWNQAQLYDQIGDYQEASSAYESASKAYAHASEKIPSLKLFYENYSLYMQAWNNTEQARYCHSIEDYDKAKQHYEKSANLHESTEHWSYLASNYFAWANMEEAEGLSRKENSQQAKQTFQKALQQFTQAEEAIKQKIGKITSTEEKKLLQKLLQASELRRRFCQARIQLEEAKLMDRTGKHLQSSKSYEEAAQTILSIVEKVESETERKELEYLSTLCQAWEKMAVAEETTSSEAYLEAAEFFEKAKEYCYTKKASLWALGNSNFCRGLAAGAEYQTMLNVEEHNRAKGYIQNAATNYFKAGYKNAAEYAKATLRLFDAYLFMNQAEQEADTEKRVKQYQLAENLLQLASGSFMEAQQPEKIAQVKQILENVKEEKKLAISFNEVLRAPSIASTTQSFTAPSPTSEVSVGLEQFQHANVQANLIAGMKEVKVGESFCLTVEFVNAGKEPALLTRVENFIPPDFTVVKAPEIYRLEETSLNMKGKQIAPLKLVEVKLILQSSKKGVYQLKPTIHYLDELGQSKSLQLKFVEIKVEEVILADRVSTGTRELDSLLLGGIPKEYSVVLTGHPSDERELIINNFLKAGTKEKQKSFYIATEADGLESLLEKSVFHLFLCNPKPKVEVPELPNVYKLHGKTDLTNLNISLLKAYRNVEQSSQKRMCINIVSDVLVDYGLKATRKWIAELTTDLVSKGFTVLAVLNPEMHPADQAAGVIELFDGEISLYQTEDPLECKKSIRVKKLRNQDYIKNAICLR